MKSFASMLGSLAASVQIFAGVYPSANIVYYYGNGPGEGLSVSSDGRRLLISSPSALPDGSFSSTVPQVWQWPQLNDNFYDIFETAVPGEVTDVAIVPHRSWGLAVVRADDVSPLNALLVLKNDQIVQTLEIPDNPDGMKVSPDGRYAIVAVEKAGEVRIYDLRRGPTHVELAAIVTRSAMEAYFVGVPNPFSALEPEAVGIAADSSFALVTLQDCSSVAALDLTVIAPLRHQRLAPEVIGDAVLKNVVHLPFGFLGTTGALEGVEPDGVSISPDNSFAIVINESTQRAKHLQSISVLDLSSGLTGISQQTYSIFQIDPTLLQNTGLSMPPIVAPGAPYPTSANALPRLDPASVEIVERGGKTVAAAVIERYDSSSTQRSNSSSNESRGSVMFLDVGEALAGSFLTLGRLPVGVSGSRLEVVDSAQQGRWIYVSISNGGGASGTAARLELIED